MIEDYKFFIVENIQLNLSLISIKKHLSVYINKNFDKEDDNSFFMHDNYIRRVLNVKICTIQFVRQLYQTRNELKMKYYNCERLSKIFNKFHFLLSYLLFIDDFNVHRNNYRFFKIFYFTFAALSYKE